MRVVKKGIGMLCRFTCPGCHSELEAEQSEMDVVQSVFGGKYSFKCPVCEKGRVVEMEDVTHTVMYEEENT